MSFFFLSIYLFFIFMKNMCYGIYSWVNVCLLITYFRNFFNEKLKKL